MLYCRYGAANYNRRSISDLAPEIYTTGGGEMIGMGTYEFLTTLVLLLALIIAIKS